MTLRKPDKEALEDAVRAAADKLNGYVILSEKRGYIQNEYAEQSTGVLNTSDVSHDEIRSILDEFAADDRKDIEHVQDETYFVNPFSASPSDDEEIIGRIEEAYRDHIAFSGETLRRRFDLPVDYADYFIDSLEQRELIERLSRTHDIHTIGDRLQEHSDEPGVEERLKSEAEDGIITNDKFEEIVDAPAIPPVTNLFERDGYITDLDGKYLVLDAIDEFKEYLTKEIVDDVEDEFDGPVMLESTFSNEVETHLAAQSSELSSISRTRRQEIVDGVESRLRDRLGIESETVDGNSIVVLTTELEDTVQEEADDIYSRVIKQEYAVAESYYEAIEEEVQSISTNGREIVNDYLRSAVLDEVWTRVQAEEFNREVEDRDADD